MKGWGSKSSVCPSKPRETKLFGGMSRDFCRDILGAPEKFEKKKFVFNFRSRHKSGESKCQPLNGSRRMVRKSAKADGQEQSETDSPKSAKTSEKVTKSGRKRAKTGEKVQKRSRCLLLIVFWPFPVATEWWPFNFPNFSQGCPGSGAPEKIPEAATAFSSPLNIGISQKGWPERCRFRFFHFFRFFLFFPCLIDLLVGLFAKGVAGTVSLPIFFSHLFFLFFPCLIDLLVGLFRRAVFRHGGVSENCPLVLMGRFPSLMGRFPTLMGRFPNALMGRFPSRESSGKQPIKKRGIKRLSSFFPLFSSFPFFFPVFFRFLSVHFFRNGETPFARPLLRNPD